MKKGMPGPLTLKLQKGEILCAAEEKNFDLFFIHKGRLLVFVNEGTKVTPIAHLGSGDYVGELSFFDRESRAANVRCLSPATLIQIPITELEKQCPEWLITMAQSMTVKLRKANELIRQKGIRKKNVEVLAPFSIDEQREYFKALQDYQKRYPHGR